MSEPVRTDRLMLREPSPEDPVSFGVQWELHGRKVALCSMSLEA